MNKHNGDYYVISLGRGRLRERFSIGVDAYGDILSVVYDGKRIQQWNGLDAEAFALQMTTESDPVWERYGDHFPGGRGQ